MFSFHDGLFIVDLAIQVVTMNTVGIYSLAVPRGSIPPRSRV